MQTPTNRKRRQRTQFGDFQTPSSLAEQVCQIAKFRCPEPTCIIEPTCGVGQLLAQAHAAFPSATRLIGAEINQAYLQHAHDRLAPACQSHQRLELIHRSFFDIDWHTLAGQQQGQILVIGNPPWVTTATLGKISASNQPNKSRQTDIKGLDAITGKSNFDISEWICLKLLESLPLDRSSFALLVKTAVARKILKKLWSQGAPISQPQIYSIDAKKAFGASVDACLFTGRLARSNTQQCEVFSRLEPNASSHFIGFEHPTLIADLAKYQRTRKLRAPTPQVNWRSGIKHDCAKVLELEEQAGKLINGLGQVVDVEGECLYPLMKSSDVASGNRKVLRKVIVTQRSTKESPQALEERVPKLWRYLQQHAEAFRARKSSIYRGRHPFSMFGIGDYSFAPYKIAISGLYKRLSFLKQGPIDGKPVLFDDTVYFLSFHDEKTASDARAKLCSPASRDFFDARIFWDAKRPITATVLRSLSLESTGPQ